MKKLIIIFFLLLILTSVVMATEYTSSCTIIELTSFTFWGGGDILIKTSNNGTGITGFWLDADDPGTKQTLALLLLAKASNADIRVTYELVQWTGSGQVYYKVYSIAIL